MRKESRKLYKRKIDHYFRSLKKFITDERADVTASIGRPGAITSFEDREKGPFTPVEPGKPNGALWEYAWIHVVGEVPAQWKGKDVALNGVILNECCVYDADGMPQYGLCNDSLWNTNSHKELYPLVRGCKGGEKVDLWIQAASAHWMSVNPITITKLQICTFDSEAWHLWIEAGMLLSIMNTIEEGSPRWSRILLALSNSASALGDSRAGIVAARAALQGEFKCTASHSDLTACCIGHAHIDTAWLWPVRTTVGKVIRTFANQIWLLDRYPEFIFGASSPYHYEIAKQYAPKLYDRIREYVRQGRWEVQGAMYVEADCNLIGGEAMIRQMLLGKNFFMDEFGVDVKNLWLPDVFGYSAAIPQIMKRSGVDYFVTQKISWNEMNRFPLTTFNWRGIDGSEVLVHFPPENTYSSELNPDSMIRAQKNLVENDVLDRFLCLYGMGDGGGGPKEDVVERGLLMRNLESCPKVEFTTADAFFKAIEGKRGQLETWTGELYLEYHRGTYTSHAKVKKQNRRLELMLTATEMLYASLPLSQWPVDLLAGVWKKVLINQFHDIIPGSSVPEVYEDTHAEYDSCINELDRLQKSAAPVLFTPEKDSCALFNPLTYRYTAPLRLPDEWNAGTVVDGAGVAHPTQRGLDGHRYALCPVNPLSFASLANGSVPAADDGAVTRLSTGTPVLENALIRYEFNRNGELLRAFDKEAGREVLASTVASNRFALYHDLPTQFEAWDIDMSYAESPAGAVFCGDVTGHRTGPVMHELEFQGTIGGSTIRQIIFLDVSSKRLDFRTTVDWREERKMLRVSFEHLIHTDTARFDIQSGFVARSTRRNTNEDIGRFESVGHMFADCSDSDYGVALLNDCKYGYKVTGATLDLNLLRSPQYPDEGRVHVFVDQGEHSFTYSLLPHCGAMVDSSVRHEASMLNQAPCVFDGYRVRQGISLPVQVRSGSVIVSALKKAEKSDAFILRLTETRGCPTRAVIALDAACIGMTETDLMEWKTDGEMLPGPNVALEFGPFAIRTFRILKK